MVKFLNRYFGKTQKDLAADEIKQTEDNVGRLQRLADFHRDMADTYQAGVDAIRKGPPEIAEEAAPAPAPAATPLRRRAA